MADQMVAHMREVTKRQIFGAKSNTETYVADVPMTVPAWLNQNAEAA